MANPFINSSFTLRPSMNNRDIPELTLRQTEVSRIPMERTETKEGRSFKRQRLFMDRFMSTAFPFGYRYSCNDVDYSYDDQYLSDEENGVPLTTRRRVSSRLTSCRRISDISIGSSSNGMNISEADYWKTRCLDVQDTFENAQARLREAEEDQRQLRQRVRELEEQLLLQSSSGNSNSNGGIGNEDYEAGNTEETFETRDRDASSNIEGKNNRIAPKHLGKDDGQCAEDTGRKNKKERPLPALVVEIKENHQAVSSCFYLTDGEGLNESYDQEMEDVSMDVYCGDQMLGDIDDDRNDINFNQQRG
ncbi:unnamed protein product [Pseudo-nitzschia multistriata]|uniref:Uncharacterized protein n=1 Tax=Pseudo-nitzschia multistriata TaxID=183589 RepID=A0A448Z1M7_9STRA|nr:unnamed protein product [Pseudo-nitzschia multistriata]